MKAVTWGRFRLCSVIYYMAGLLWSSLQFVSCRTVIVEGTMSDERRRSHSHLHHMPGLTFNDRSKLSVTLLKCEPRQNHISLKHETLILVIYSFNFWVGHPCSQLLLCLLLCLSVLSLGQIFELEPCGPYRWNSSIHCVTVKHQQHEPLVRNGYGMKVTQEKYK